MTSTLAGQSDLEAMESLRGKLRLEQTELAKIIGVDPATIYRWRQGESRPRAIYRSRLVQLQEVFELLTQLFAGPKLAREWLRTATPESLGGSQTPIEVMLGGRIDRVLNTLHFVARGA